MNDVNKKVLANLKIACASRGITMTAFAKSIGIGGPALSRWASGLLKSRNIEKQVHDLVDFEFEKMGFVSPYKKGGERSGSDKR